MESPCCIRQAPSSEDRGLCSGAEGVRRTVSSLEKLWSGGLTATSIDVLPVLFRELPAATSGE